MARKRIGCWAGDHSIGLGRPRPPARGCQQQGGSRGIASPTSLLAGASSAAGGDSGRPDATWLAAAGRALPGNRPRWPAADDVLRADLCLHVPVWPADTGSAAGKPPWLVGPADRSHHASADGWRLELFHHDCPAGTHHAASAAVMLAAWASTKDLPERAKNKAGDETRTHDIQLGKLALYQLSYARRFPPSVAAESLDTRGRANRRGWAGVADCGTSLPPPDAAKGGKRPRKAFFSDR